MEYTVKELAQLAGISSRTVRYYDEIDILKPARINSSGYRIYGQNEIDHLQQILFYRELGVSLKKIKKILEAPSFNELNALKDHQTQLLEKRKQLDILLNNLSKTIAAKERGIIMSDSEKFEGFKKKLIEENEEKYGEEIRAKYGEETVNKSNNKLQNMSQKEYDELTKLTEELNQNLSAAFQTGDPAGELAQKAVELHRQWLSFYWDRYSKEAHAGLAEMYVADERFKAHYDKEQPGTAEFLREAIRVYTGMDK